MPRGDDPLYDPNAPFAPPAAPVASPPPTISPSPASGAPSGPGRGRGSDPLYIPEARSAASPSPSPASGGPPPQPAGQNDLGTTAVWNKPADVSWGDYMLAHLAKPFQGANQAAQDYSRVAADTATFGLGDRLQSYLTGNPLENERAETNAAYGRLGAMAPIVGGAMYAVGPGELSAAARGAGWLGNGVLGSMGEGAAAGALGAAGHDENPVVGGLAGGTLGGIAGGVSKMFAPGPFSSAVAKQRADITSTAKAARDQAYSALDAPKYDQTELLDELDQAKSDLYANDPDGTLPRAAPRSLKAFNDLYVQTANAPYKTPSASSILDTIQRLDDVQGHGAGAENDVAPFLQDRLNGILSNLDPVTAHTPADVQEMLATANQAHKTFKNAEGLQQGGQSLKAFGTSPAGWAQDVAEKYYGGQAPLWAINPKDPAAEQYAALQAINKAAGGGGMTPYGAMHMLHQPIEMGAEGLGAALGGPTGAMLGGMAGNALSYGLVKPAAGAALGKAAQRGVQQRINQAYPALVPGQTIAPPSDYGRALRTLLLGGMSSAGY